MGQQTTDEKYMENTLENQIYPVLSENISTVLKSIKKCEMSGIEEIRIRANKPLMILRNQKDFCVCADGSLVDMPSRGWCVCNEDIQRTIQLMSNYSVYSIGEELKQGFLTLPGGHRIGLAGKGVMERNELKLLKNISSLNIRIAREVKGCALPLLKEMHEKEKSMGNTLLVSPPGFGKTTMLRDMVRILSNGDKHLGIKGCKIGIVDERSEIAGCHLGMPQRDVGFRTDVLDSCRKVDGINLLIRSMSPEIIAVDEIGSVGDAEAIENAINSGVCILATAHGRDLKEARMKKGIDRLIEQRLLHYVVVLDRAHGPGSISDIITL